jgi:hypothetical protein
MLDTSVVKAVLELNTRKDLAEFLDGLSVLYGGEQSWAAVTDEGILNIPGDEHFLGAMITACDLQPEWQDPKNWSTFL